MSDLEGVRVALTGRLASMTRREAAELVRARGGVPTDSVSKKTDLLVLGQEGWPLTPDGRLSRKLRRARELKAGGHGIAVVSEDEFLRRAGLDGERAGTRRLYTTAQLARILSVPGRTVRAWVRKGLISAVRTEHRLSWFDFGEAVTAKAVADLVAAGVGADRLERSLEELRRLLPDAVSPLRHLQMLERGGELIVRLDDGRLADRTGQLQFDFEASPAAAPLAAPSADRTVDDWFEEGLAREDDADLEAAARAYERALALGAGDPEIHFNLGNVLFGLGRPREAADSYRRAIEADPSYVEAMNNLGNVLSESDRRAEAIPAFRRALAVEPRYADAHYNLAETLHAAGEAEEARRHWLAYLEEDPTSDWADRVRERLGEG